MILSKLHSFDIYYFNFFIK